MIKRERLLRAKDTEAQRVKGRSTNAVGTRYAKPGELFTQVTRGSPSKGHGEDAPRDHSVLQEACDPPHHRKGLTRAGACEYVENTAPVGGNVAVRSCEPVVPSRHFDVFEELFMGLTSRSPAEASSASLGPVDCGVRRSVAENATVRAHVCALSLRSGGEVTPST